MIITVTFIVLTSAQIVVVAAVMPVSEGIKTMTITSTVYYMSTYDSKNQRTHARLPRFLNRFGRLQAHRVLGRWCSPCIASSRLRIGSDLNVRRL